jgi:hypothetical protein
MIGKSLSGPAAGAESLRQTTYLHEQTGFRQLEIKRKGHE